MILDIEQKSHELCISYFDKEGSIDYIHLNVPVEERYNWEICRAEDPSADPIYKTWDNKPCKKVQVSDVRKLSKYRVEELMTKNSDKLQILYDFNMPKKYFVDIEVEVIDGFPDAETAPNKVTTISIANSQSKVVSVIGLKPLSEKECTDIENSVNKHFEKFGEKWNFRYYHFDSEYAMLYDFFKKMIPKCACISGWNFTGYDWPYLLKRVERINKLNKGSEQIKAEWASPSSKILGKNNYPQHRLIVDYLEIYKKWDRVVKIKENNKLDYVAQQAIGVEKIKYNGNFKDLYEKDYIKYVFYNAVDSVLVHYIDKKLNTMLTFLKLGHVTGVEAKKAFSPIWMMEAMTARESLKDNKIFVGNHNDEIEQKPFEGAYVKEPQKGYYEWITCYDFASLYPNTMMQYNISPETFVGTNVEPKDGEVKVGVNVGERGITWRVFKNDSDSVLRRILKNMYAKRKATKQKYLSINKEIDILTKHLAGNVQ